jgi:hypothetical protein
VQQRTTPAALIRQNARSLRDARRFEGRSARGVHGTQSASSRILPVPPSPYRFLARPAPRPPRPSRGPSLDIAVPVAIAWTLGLVRVTCALLRSDAPSHELDIAWLLVVVAPVIIWHEIAAWREQRG